MLLRRNAKTPIQREWDNLKKKEQNFSEKRASKKETALNSFLAEKVPEKLQNTLDKAFEKAFNLIFEKGTGIIEKTYNKEKLQKEHKINLYADEVYGDRKSLHKFSQKANRAGNINILLSGVSGIGMGILGVGIPDIPVFTTMILKSIYEIALDYGFEYESEEEKYFILLIIDGAVSYGNHYDNVNKKVDEFINCPQLPADYNRSEQIAETSGMLSKELLYMKFLQGIPVVGAVGGAYDIAYMKQISEYARMKYKKRFLKSRKEGLE